MVEGAQLRVGTQRPSPVKPIFSEDGPLRLRPPPPAHKLRLLFVFVFHAWPLGITSPWACMPAAGACRNPDLALWTRRINVLRSSLWSLFSSSTQRRGPNQLLLLLLLLFLPLSRSLYVYIQAGDCIAPACSVDGPRHAMLLIVHLVPHATEIKARHCRVQRRGCTCLGDSCTAGKTGAPGAR